MMSIRESTTSTTTRTEEEEEEEEEELGILLSQYSITLLRTLRYNANIQFLRYTFVDLYNTVRCKTYPIDFLLSLKKKSTTTSSSTSRLSFIDYPVEFATVVVGGLPSHGDFMSPETSGIDATGTVYFHCDISTLHVLPYPNTKSAIIFGDLVDKSSSSSSKSKSSDLCARSLLKRIVSHVEDEHGVGLNVGIEIEFCLYHRNNDKPIDYCNFAETTTLDRQQDFICTLYEYIHDKLFIDIEMIHSESCYGQYEIVIQYQQQQNNHTSPIVIADSVVLVREIIKHVAYMYHMKAIFLPKVDSMRAGNGCHIHMSLYNHNNNKNKKEKKDTTSTSTTTTTMNTILRNKSKSFIEGILQHLPSLLAFTAPSSNSFSRIGPGCWTGSQVSWAYDDKESGIRVIGTNDDDNNYDDENIENDKNENNSLHFEYKLSDSKANIYLALATIIIAGMDGMKRNVQLRPPSSSSSATSEKQQQVDKLPSDFYECLRLFGDVNNGSCKNNSNKNKVRQFYERFIPSSMMKAYIAMRYEESRLSRTIEEELRDALLKA